MFRSLRTLLGAIIILPTLASAAFGFRCDVTATGLAFGSYDIFSPTPLDTTGVVNVSCTIPPQNPAAPLLVTISLSPGSSGSFAQRQMQSTAPTRLNYNLFTDASFSTVWGDGSGSSAAQTALVTSDTPFRGSIYGRIPPSQNAAVGTYRDVVTVTIEW